MSDSEFEKADRAAKRAEQRRKTAMGIEVAKMNALAMIGAAIRAQLPRFVAELSDAEWEKLKRDEDRRREGAKP
jgi:hypothetical protein